MCPYSDNDDTKVKGADDTLIGNVADSLKTNVTNFPATQPVSLVSQPLPTGASTSALQTTGNTTLTTISGKLPATLGQKAMTASMAVVIASDQAALAVTGPLTDAQLRAAAVVISAATLPLPTGASTSALQTTGNNSLASIDSKLTAPLVVTGPLTDVQLRATAVPVSLASQPLPTGASTSALQTTGNNSLASIDAKLTNPLPVSGTVNVGNFPATQNVAVTSIVEVEVKNDSGSALPISAAALPLPTGAATSALQTTGNASLSSIDAKLTAPLSVTGPLTDAQLRATAVPVSAAALPLPTGASTSALQTTGNTSVASIDTKTPALVSGRVPVDGSAVTQPVSAVSLPLPAGAATSALQTTGNASLSSMDSKLPTVGQKTMAGSQPVVMASDQSPLPLSGNNTENSFYSIQPLLNGASPVMVVNGTLGAPVIFSYVVPAGQQRILESMRMFIQDNGVADPFKFGAIGAGDLTNGVVIEVILSGTTYLMANIKNNMELGMIFSNSPQMIPTTSGWYNNNDSYAGQWDMRSRMLLKAGDTIRVKIQDALSSLDNFRIYAELVRYL